MFFKKNKVKVGGIWYAIKEKDLPDTDCGELCRESNTIFLDSRISQEQKEYALIHEIIHALNGELEETIVDSLAFGIHQILRDN